MGLIFRMLGLHGPSPGLIFEALGLEKLKPKVARLRLDFCWLIPSLLTSQLLYFRTNPLSKQTVFRSVWIQTL
jgi:hypothetical protein